MPERSPPSLARALLLGCRAGLVALLGLYAACAVFNMKLGYQGNENAALSDWVWREWRPVVLWQVAKLVGAYTAVGLVLGTLLGGGAWALGVRRVFRAALLACLLVVALAVAGDMAHHPHVYAASLYGGTWSDTLRALSGTWPAAWAFAAWVLPVSSALALLYRGWQRGWRRLTLGVLGATTLVGVLAFLPEGRPTRAAAQPLNIVVLAADGLRPDHLGGNGYPRATSPHIDRLLAEGTQFTDTVVQLPRTAPSWATLLTSQWAGVHPVRHTLVGRSAREAPLTTIATVLGERGWRTSAVADYAGDLFGRFRFGFQHVEAPGFTFPELIRQRMLVTHVALLPFTALVPGLFPERGQLPELTDPGPLAARVHRELARLDDGRQPFFLLVFGSTTHFPYAAPHPFEGRWVERDYAGPWRFGTSPQMEAVPGLAPPSHDDVAALEANYDAGVAAFDALVGEVREELARRGLLEHTLLVVLSDHGEHLMESPERGQGHGDHLWGTAALRIPFVLRLPETVAQGRRVDQRARSLDVAPTLLDLVGVPAPVSFMGRSLAPLARPDGPPGLPDAPALLETDLWFSDRDGQPYQRARVPYPWVYETATVERPHGDIALKPEWEGVVERSKHRGLYLGRWKLLELPTVSGVRVQLFDTQADPEERRDVSADQPDVVRELRTRLARERSWDIVGVSPSPGARE